MDGALNRGGLLIAAQQPFPALEPLLFRTHRARRVVIVETPGHAEEAGRERLHLGALRHFLRVSRPSDVVVPPDLSPSGAALPADSASVAL